jgi:hypothetical protein
VRQRQTKATVEGALHRWCLANGCTWGQAVLLDRVEWDHLHGAYGRRGPALVLCTDGSELADVLTPAGRSRYTALNAALQACLGHLDLGLAMITPAYAGLYRPARTAARRNGGSAAGSSLAAEQEHQGHRRGAEEQEKRQGTQADR